MVSYPSRSVEFGFGTSGSQATSIGVEHTSVLMPYMRSPNGMSSKDATRQTPFGQLPNSNGSSQNTYSAQFPSLTTSVTN